MYISQISKAWFTLATETEAETEAETKTGARNPIQTLQNGDGTEENKPFRSLAFRLCFTGFVWNFVLPSLSPSPLPSLV